MEVDNLKFDILYFLFCRYIFIRSRPSGSNDTMQVIRKGSIRNRQLNRQSIPNIIIDPQPNFFRKLLCVRLSESVDDSSPASSTTQPITPLSTVCVMLSTYNIRRESHAAARDVLQPLPIIADNNNNAISPKARSI